MSHSYEKQIHDIHKAVMIISHFSLDKLKWSQAGSDVKNL